jgi:3-oxoacyl-(acyl-carrier-protein) synthase
MGTRYASLPAGVVPMEDSGLRQMLAVDDPAVTRTALLGLKAMQEAVADAGLDAEELSSASTALITGSTVGGMSAADHLYLDVTERRANSPLLASYDCSAVTLFLQRYYKMRGIIDTINTACSSSANAIIYGARLIRNGFARTVVAGGMDALSKFTINGFSALRILSPDICAPFDAGRKGLNLGEGAAFLVLEGEGNLPRGKKTYGELTGFHNCSDAFHPTSLSPEGIGPLLSMQGALNSAGLHPREIDLINTHGTGTENNDWVESNAMLKAFETVPPFVSTKSYTGHTLGAAAAVEAVFSLLSLEHQELYAGLQFAAPIPEFGLRPVTNRQRATIRHVMSNSFGFGGSCSSLIFSKS